MLLRWSSPYIRVQGVAHLVASEYGSSDAAYIGGKVNMTYVITEPCIDVKDQSCVEVCPVDCIHADDEDRILYISPDECIDCGACHPACPVTAIFAEDDVPEEWSGYTEVNAQWFDNKDDARVKVGELAP